MPATVYSNAIGKSCCIIHTHDAKRTRATHFLYSLEQARSYRSRIDSLAQYRRSLIHPSIRPSAESQLNIPMISRRGHVLVSWLVAADKSRARANFILPITWNVPCCDTTGKFSDRDRNESCFLPNFSAGLAARDRARARSCADVPVCIFLVYEIRDLMPPRLRH